MSPDEAGDWGPIEVGGTSVEPGEARQLELPVARLPSATLMHLELEVLRGAAPGPGLWLSGAIHGDEIIGVEIIREVLDRVDPAELSGTIIAAPVVNVFGFVTGSRYLPDRRDLNRSFPGSRRGSLAARLARLFINEVVDRCEYGIDFHAGSDDRTNLPQVRGDLDDPETRRLAEAFAPPVIIRSRVIKGTIRGAATKRDKTVLLFEGGEPRRFSVSSRGVGVPGTLRVLAALGMLEHAPAAPSGLPALSFDSRWVRASRGGIFRIGVKRGSVVGDKQVLGTISDPRGNEVVEVLARHSGLVIGHSVNPLVHQGDALVHVAKLAARPLPLFESVEGGGGEGDGADDDD